MDNLFFSYTLFLVPFLTAFSFFSQVGTKVAAVSRKTNTTTHEVLGVMTKEETQIVR